MSTEVICMKNNNADKCLSFQCIDICTYSSICLWLLYQTLHALLTFQEGEYRSQFNSSKRSEVKDPLTRGSAVNMVCEEENLFIRDNIPMLPLSSKRVNQNFVTNADIDHLRKKVEQMEQNLQRKEFELQAAETKARQISWLNAKVERLESQIQEKDEAVRKLEDQLYERQV